MDMDPNEALKKLREFMARVGDQVECGEEVDEDDVGFIVETWEGLDGWLKKGGFPPKDWLDKQGNPLDILEAIHRFFRSAANLQLTEGRSVEGAAYIKQAQTIKYAIDILTGHEPVPKFSL
jgi:hypothetical protein